MGHKILFEISVNLSFVDLNYVKYTVDEICKLLLGRAFFLQWLRQPSNTILMNFLHKLLVVS